MPEYFLRWIFRIQFISLLLYSDSCVSTYHLKTGTSVAALEEMRNSALVESPSIHQTLKNYFLCYDGKYSSTFFVTIYGFSIQLYFTTVREDALGLANHMGFLVKRARRLKASEAENALIYHPYPVPHLSHATGDSRLRQRI